MPRVHQLRESLRLCDLVRERRPVLVVIDPLVSTRSHSRRKSICGDYAALGPLIDVAREIGTHVVFSHHAGKGMKTDSVDSPSEARLSAEPFRR